MKTNTFLTMKSIFYFSGLFLLLINLTGCTIEKRQYRSGYHIDWHFRDHKVPGDHNAGLATKSDAGTAPVEAKEEDLAMDTLSSDTAVMPEPTVIADNEQDIVASTNDNEIRTFSLPLSYFGTDRKMDKVLSAEPAQQHPLADVSLFTGLGSFAAGLIYAAIVGVISDDINNASFANTLAILALISAIVAIVTGNKVVRDIKTSPGSYAGEIKARIGRTLGWIYIILILLSFILLILLIAAIF
jgi:hypothetical protein